MTYICILRCSPNMKCWEPNEVCTELGELATFFGARKHTVISLWIYYALETCLLVKRGGQMSVRKKIYSFRNLVKNFMQVKIRDTITPAKGRMAKSPSGNQKDLKALQSCYERTKVWQTLKRVLNTGDGRALVSLTQLQCMRSQLRHWHLSLFKANLQTFCKWFISIIWTNCHHS